MPSVYSLKPAFQSLLRPISNRLAAIGATANQVTILTCVISIAVGLHLAYGSRQWAVLPIWLFLRMALNAIDGLLAREHGQASPLGALLNELSDFVSDAVLLLPFAYLPNWNPAWIGAVVVLSGLTEMTSVCGQALTGERRNDGPMGKSDRALVLGATAAWIALGRQASPAIPPLLALFLLATVYNRVNKIVVKRN